MATSAVNPYLQPQQYNPATVNYLNQDYNSSNPRTIASNQQGMNAQASQAAQTNANQAQSFLNPTEQSLATGGGGYTPDQISQIEMSPQQQQQLVTQAGISAGTGTAAGVDAAQRATNAAGGNPAALAAYRARAAGQEGAQAGNAAVGASVAGQQALSGETENVGQAQQAQQNVGLGLQSQYQNQQNTDVQNAQKNAQTGVGQGLTASQTPSTFDQVVGGIGGALSFLDEGGPSRTAIVAEQSPEAVVKMNPRYLDVVGGSNDSGSSPTGGTSNPNPPPTPILPGKFADAGDMPDMGGYTPPAGAITSSEEVMPSQPYDAGMGTQGSQGSPAASTPWYQRLKAAISAQPAGSQAPGAAAHTNSNPATQQPASMQAASSLGSSIGKLASSFLDEGWTGKEPGTWGGSSAGNINSVAKFLADGTPLEAADGAIFTKPTQVKMAQNEAAVPLGYRARAKTRPSMAMPVVKQLQQRKMYGMGA
jgi:hypothetical protein